MKLPERGANKLGFLGFDNRVVLTRRTRVRRPTGHAEEPKSEKHEVPRWTIVNCPPASNVFVSLPSEAVWPRGGEDLCRAVMQ